MLPIPGNADTGLMASPQQLDIGDNVRVYIHLLARMFGPISSCEWPAPPFVRMDSTYLIRRHSI